MKINRYFRNSTRPNPMPDKGASSPRGSHRGLQTETNPLLLSSNPNLIRRQYRGQNPYLSTSGIEDKKIRKRFEKGLKFHEKGEISAAIDRKRSLLKSKEDRELKRRRLQEKHREEIRNKIEKGELPNTNLGEEKFAPQEVPTVEWWDKPYLDEDLRIISKYTTDTVTAEAGESDDSDDDEHPSIRYVEHPIPVRLSALRYVPKVYLTKSEQKKIRRNRRKLQREEHEARIKLGIEPKPETKVSLGNMMNVYENNQNITDPTAWEATVKEQVANRKKKHEETNMARHEEACNNKKSTPPTDVSTNYDHCKVYKFQNLRNPRIRFKLNTNARQLSLRGLCLRVGENGSGFIVIAGSDKACRHYDRLVTKRIRWDEKFQDRETQQVIDADGNHAEKVWEGEWKGPSWGPFFMKVCKDEQEMENLLRQRDAQHLLLSINNS